MPRDSVDTAFLNVERSLTGRRWAGPDAETDRQAERLRQDTGVPDPVARVLARQGVPGHEVAAYLEPTLRDLLPDPMTLRDMGPAAERFVAAVEQRERIAVFADYDVDGGASAALLITWLREAGLRGNALCARPDRRGIRPQPGGHGKTRRRT